MMSDVILKFEEIKFTIKKNSKSIVVLFAFLVVVNMLYFKLNLNIDNELNNYIIIGLNLVVIGIWLLYNFTYVFSLGIKKEKRFMAIFRFNGNDIKKYDLIRDKFLSKLKRELLDKGIVVKYVEFRGKDKSKGIQKIYKKSYSCIVFDVEESTGKIDNIWSYVLKLDSINSKIAANMPEKMKISFKNDMSLSIEKYYKITENNSIIDIEIHKALLEMGILYLTSIVYIITNKVEECYLCLQELEKMMNSIELSNSRSFNYIKIEINKRYLELYAEVIRQFFNEPDEFSKKHIDLFLSDLYVRTINLKNKIPKKMFEEFLNDYYSSKIMRVYKTNGVAPAKEVYNEWYKSSMPKNYYQTLDYAFLLAHEKKYYESIKVYKNCFKNQIIEPHVITEILSFISNDKINEKDYPNIFCECIINMQAADKSIAYEDLDILRREKYCLYELICNELGCTLINDKRY